MGDEIEGQIVGAWREGSGWPASMGLMSDAGTYHSHKTDSNNNSNSNNNNTNNNNQRTLTPNVMITKNILKNTRKMTLFAKAMGMMPRKVVIAPTTTDGPISPRARAIRKSFAIVGS